MKPYLTIKTVKGKKYFQLTNIKGDLIHLGPAKKIETWSVAYQALQDAYEAFCLQELLAFKSIADEEGINLVDALNATASGAFRDSEKWKAFQEKQIKKRLSDYLLMQIIRGFDINDPQVLEGLNKLEGHLRAHEKTGRVVGASPELVEMAGYLVKLYEEKPVEEPATPDTVATRRVANSSAVSA